METFYNSQGEDVAYIDKVLGLAPTRLGSRPVGPAGILYPESIRRTSQTRMLGPPGSKRASRKTSARSKTSSACPPSAKHILV